MAYKVAIGMSGGVDSSVAAWLLKEQGHDLLGLTLRLFAPCGGKDGEADARAVADHLQFPHEIIPLDKEFRAEVMDPFVACYERGQTPNPCIQCNRNIKFGILLDRAIDAGCDAFATGHYAKVERDMGTGRYLLKKGTHTEKDQSYFLYALNQRQLAHTLLPLGGLSKTQIREIAHEQKLVNASRGDSQDICFIPDGDYATFIRNHTGRTYPTGNFVGEDGEVLGEHQGIINYTVGQRRGLAVSAAQRLYVREISPENNAVVLTTNDALYSKTLTADTLNLIATDRLDTPIRAGVRIRSRHAEQPATVEQTGADTIRVTFDTPQRAITPGQAVVMYDGDVVIGGGIITGL